VGVAQGYEQIALYRDVLVPEGRDEEFLTRWHQTSTPRLPAHPPEESQPTVGSPTVILGDEGIAKNASVPTEGERTVEPATNGNAEVVRQERFRLDNAIRSQVDTDLDHLMSFKGRDELEEVYGIPAIVRLANIPLQVF
jgi:hypothetical protein